MALKLGTTSALNLILQGSVGSFSVGHGSNGHSSIEVKYFLTDIGLDFQSGASTDVLQHLMPVREMFDAGTLEFDELMQRDIDDARVSSELIPYLLDRRSRDLVKLFPPIIVVVLPLQPGSNNLADRYPAVQISNGKVQGQEDDFLITRSGEIGQEAFEFQQPISGTQVLHHDFVRLLLNMNRIRLVIVDGQHRAMALLALYRNLKQDWSDARRAPFKDYYEEWTENYIRDFDIKKISIPVMFCTFPSIDENYNGEYDLKKAARAIFLTLNKNARKVTESRNRLLDDNDLIAWFMRDTLSIIKNKDFHSPRSLRGHNIELDQPSDRTKIADPIAISGVNHVYYMIEHLVLNQSADVKGVKPRTGRFGKRTDLGVYGCSDRLNMLDLLGTEAAEKTSRDFFNVEDATKLTKQFRKNFGTLIVQMFETFEPYEAHNKASLWLEQKLIADGQNRIKPILFEGQGVGRVFENHLSNLREKNKPPKAELTQIITRLDATQQSIRSAIEEFKKVRATNFLDRITDKSKLRNADGEYVSGIVEFVNKTLFETIFRTVAFQTALIAGFFGEIERANATRSHSQAPIDTAAAFVEFLSQMNAFFSPTSTSGFKRLVECFHKKIEGEIKEWKLAATTTTFRHVVYRGEMQPDEWPKYKYLMLELWRPTDETLKASVDKERAKCQVQIYNSLVEEVRDEALQKLSKRIENLTDDEQKQIDDDAYNAFKGFLQNLGQTMSQIPSHKIMKEKTENNREDADPVAPNPDQDSWQETDSI